ncbi:hypothetical protein CDL12_07215 [Handroanthus impetiginosus]|uniref:DUF7804 domain-containing protein n=1 Tax=Handroanthus impetiginosus TaxID=429701 RepID=A0A2G9HRG6_9LAMI|nr:hypothetical protein CDL12_07215 [Handroanthus impetiginosus]
MTSWKPVRWSCSYAGPDKACHPSRKNRGLTWFETIYCSRRFRILKSNLCRRKSFLDPSSPFMEQISPISVSSKASPCHHIVDLDSTCQLHRTSTHHIHPFPGEKESMKEEDEEEEEISSQKLDQWVRDSAVEIVNNLNEAPFLVHIYCNGKSTNRDGSTPNTRIKMVKEKAIADDWSMIEGRWKGGSGTPNGVILVEELDTSLDEAAKTRDEMVKVFGLNNQSCSSTTKLWGILIQGKGKGRTACYLLKTSQVQCVAGLCTHFCLLRVERFMEPADIQLKKFWLQMG